MSHNKANRSELSLVEPNHHLAYLFSSRDVKKVLIVNLKRVGFGALMQTAWRNRKEPSGASMSPHQPIKYLRC